VVHCYCLIIIKTLYSSKNVQFYVEVGIVSYTGNWVCDIALIGCTLSLGKTREGSGFRREGYKGTMGDKGSQFTSNLGLRWTIPVTAGESQVIKREYSKGKYSKGKCAMCSRLCNSCSCTYWNDWIDERYQLNVWQ
jgi:hypothetical protein